MGHGRILSKLAAIVLWLGPLAAGTPPGAEASLRAASAVSPGGTTVAAGWIDLHAHLFMAEGLGYGWLEPWTGSFTSPLRARDWQDRLVARVNEDALRDSGARLVVVALYAHPLFRGELRDAIRRQIRGVREFVARHPEEWALARSAGDARARLAEGRRVLVFSLEGAAGILESDADLREFIDDAGVRIVTLVHFMDDHLGAVAFLPGIRGLLSPVAWLRALWDGHRAASPDVLTNERGLAPDGQALVERLVDRGVWIDLAHASDKLAADLVPWMEARHLPLLHTHTAVRAFYRSERGISEQALQAVGRSRGIVGIIPSQDMLGDPVSQAAACGAGCTEACRGGLAGLSEHLRWVARRIGLDATGLGSDVDAPLNFLPPACFPASTAQHADDPGYWSYAQMGEVWKELSARLGGSGLQAARFLEAWGRAEGARQVPGRAFR